MNSENQPPAPFTPSDAELEERLVAGGQPVDAGGQDRLHAVLAQDAVAGLGHDQVHALGGQLRFDGIGAGKAVAGLAALALVGGLKVMGISNSP